MTVQSVSRNLILFLTLSLLLLAPSCGPAILVDAPTTTPPASTPGPSPESAPPELIQASTPYSENIRFERIGLEEGLSQSVVHVIMQDHKGFLWVGTEDGLNRFDGYRFRVYRPDADNPFSLSDRWITALAEDPQGYLWVGTRLGGLNRYDPNTGKFTRFNNNNSNEDNAGPHQINALLADQQGLWIGTENGLHFLDFSEESFEQFKPSLNDANNPSNYSITTIYKDSASFLWIGTSDGGLYRYDRFANAFRAFRYDKNDPDSLSSNRVLSITGDRNGDIWVGTANGLNRYEATLDYFTRFTHSDSDSDSIGGNTIYALRQDQSGGLWIGTNNGLDRYDSQTRKFIHHRHQPTVANSLSHSIVYSIYEDRSGVIWLGTYGGGLNKYNRQQDKFAYFRHNPDNPNSLSDDFVLPIVVDTSGTAWIGTYGSGLNRFNPVVRRFTHYRHDPNVPESLGDDEVLSLALDNSGFLWVGTSSGLDLLDPTTATFTHFRPDSNDPKSLAGAPVYVIYQDHLGRIWVGNYRGLDQFMPESQSFIHYRIGENSADNPSGYPITAILEDENFNLWLGTFDDGLKRIDSKTGHITNYKNDPNDPKSIGSNSILCIYQDKHGTLWIGTTGGGLNRYEPSTDSFTHITEKDGLPNNVIYGILEDTRGMLWLSTNHGLSRFNPVDNTFRNFTSSDGLQSNEFNQNAFAKSNRGELYFGGINGFNMFRPGKIIDNNYVPPVVVTSITQEGKPLNGEVMAESLNEIVLTWPQDSFEFEFAALAYGQPSKNQYAYILENFDSSWNEIGTQRNGRYTNLPGGTYTLLLRGSNSDGVWNDTGTSVKVTVIPPFWQTWWFRIVVGLAAVTLVAGGYRLRLKGIENRNRELDRLVQKRTADLQKRSLEIEALYQADEKILRNVTLNQVFQTLVDVSVSLLKADRSLILAWDEEQTHVIPRVSYGFKKKTLELMKFVRGEGIIGKVLVTGQPVIEPDLNPNDLRPDIRAAILEEGIKSFAHLPIKVDEKVVAVFNVGFTRPNAINDDILRLYTALVQRASLSIANMELFEQTKDLAVIEERNRLARDLHDSAKQKAFAALAQLGTVNGMLKFKPDGIKPHLTEAETLIYEVIQELTFLIQEIYPIALQEKGLATTLREYIFEWETRNDIVVNLSVRNERPLPLETEQAIYRVIQEALANVSRHSQAKRVDISLVYNTDSLQVSIADDGRGFDVNQRAKGMGFRSMRERIGSIRGTIQTQSAPGQGTRVLVQVPIKGERRENKIEEAAV
jgi:ligand-binding sensor domain-containing protein/signal transduction histidine kinase